MSTAVVAAVLSALTVLVMPPVAGAALTVPPGPVVDPLKPDADISKVVPLARKQLKRRVRERKGNNVPRFRNGKGRIAPYSIRDQWCVAFSTWVWGKVGFDSYLGTRYLRQSWDRSLVAIQVADLSRWAKLNGYWSYRARPGYLVAYGGSHIGIVTKADREGRAVRSIEGNKGDGVRRVRIEMENVTGYISPVRLTPDQKLTRNSALADVG